MKTYIEEFHNRKLFCFEDAVNLIGNDNSAKDLLYNYKKQKLICSVRRNLYVATDLATKKSIATKFEIGSNITPTSYISYHTALEYHGIAHQVFYDLYVSSEGRFNNFAFDGINYQYCESKINLGVLTPNLDSLVKVTDIERTVIDCIDRIDRAGGLEELIHSFSLITYLNEEKLKLYIDEHAKTFLYQKTGFILSYFRQETKISDNFIFYCKQNIGQSVRYLTTREESPVFFKEWNLCAPENILSYLEQGGSEIV
jgi:predicted transcriptional regulator of viral defense system